MTKKAVFGGLLALLSSLVVIGAAGLSYVYATQFSSAVSALSTQYAPLSLQCPQVSTALSDLSSANMLLQTSSILLILVGICSLVGAILLFAKRYKAGAILLLATALTQVGLSFVIGSQIGFLVPSVYGNVSHGQMGVPISDYSGTPLYNALISCAAAKIGSSVQLPSTSSQNGLTAGSLATIASVPVLVLLIIASLTGFLSHAPGEMIHVNVTSDLPARERATTRFCSDCGKRLREGARFCEGCGAAVSPVTDSGTF